MALAATTMVAASMAESTSVTMTVTATTASASGEQNDVVVLD
jgi:hypothetical protein